MRRMIALACLLSAGNALGQVSVQQNSLGLTQSLHGQGCLPARPTWQPQSSVRLHPNGFSTGGIGSNGWGNYITPRRSVDEIPGYRFVEPSRPVPGWCGTPPTIQPYPLPKVCDPAPVCPPTVVYPYPYRSGYSYGDGFYLNGRYRGDRWNVQFNIGSGLLPSLYEFGGLFPMRVGNYEYTVNPYTGGYTVTTARGEAPIDPRMMGAGAMPTPPVPAAPAKELTPIEQATAALADYDALRAIKALRAHLKSKADDAPAMRVLAMALLEHGQIDDGVAMMRQAYRTQKDLADDPWTPDEVGMSARRVREVLTKVVGYAHRANSASAWLTVASIMQAEGRTALAKQMLDRAAKAGLEKEMVGAFEKGLRL